MVSGDFSEERIWTFHVVSSWIKPKFLGLPRSLCDAWKLTTVRHFAETDTADAELLVDRVRTAAALATCVTTYLELWLASCLNLE
jgi:hypothetical protein